MYIDTHVHCRDEEEFEKETIRHVLEVAERAGVDAVFDILNTKQPGINKERILRRLEIADSCNSPVFYGVYVGLTKEPKQIEESVLLYDKFFPRVVGLKLFAGKSVGDLAIVELEDQRTVYRELAKNGYCGPVKIHCEKESLMDAKWFDQRIPLTHSLARPEIAEVVSIKDQVELAWNECFNGTIHIAHVSSPRSVEYINSVKKNLSDIKNVRIVCEATFHHLFWNSNMTNCSEGLLLKVNPPLRARASQEKLLKQLLEGEIDYISTDHAPHELAKKMGEPYFSGIPGLQQWPHIYKKLMELGMERSKIDNLVFFNALRLFGLEDVVKRTDDTGDLNIKDYNYLVPKNVQIN